MNQNNQNRNATGASRSRAQSNINNRTTPSGTVRRTPSTPKKPTGIGRIAFWHCSVAAAIYWELLLYFTYFQAGLCRRCGKPVDRRCGTAGYGIPPGSLPRHIHAGMPAARPGQRRTPPLPPACAALPAFVKNFPACLCALPPMQ